MSCHVIPRPHPDLEAILPKLTGDEKPAKAGKQA
jgi:microcompartment protein CcmL/EutN